MFDLNTKKIKKFLHDTVLESDVMFLQETSKLSSFKAGGKCICVFFVINIAELCSILNFLKKAEISFYIIGGGTNTLFADDFIDAVVIKLAGGFNYLKIAPEGDRGDKGQDNIISAGAAYSLERFVVEAAKSGFDFSPLAGIPGTLGGAVAGNAGNTQSGICRYLKSIRYAGLKEHSFFSLEAQISGDDYAYRTFKLNILPVITDIYLTADCADRTEIFKKIRHNIKIKKSAQPLNTKNAGCFFKNPAAGAKYSSGEMIDMCGLKGFKYGGARVSAKHANFLENYDNASAGDIYILSKIVKDFVKKRFKIDLEYEVKMVGF
jgi:UDP-N-acetylmuramate dehydrogenase